MTREIFANRIENRENLPVCKERFNKRRGIGFHVHISIPDEKELESMDWPVLSNYVEEQIEVGLPKFHRKNAAER